MANVIPDTDNVKVAMIAAAIRIAQLDTSGPRSQENRVKVFKEVYEAISEVVEANNSPPRESSIN